MQWPAGQRFITTFWPANGWYDQNHFYNKTFFFFLPNFSISKKSTNPLKPTAPITLFFNFCVVLRFKLDWISSAMLSSSELYHFGVTTYVASTHSTWYLGYVMYIFRKMQNVGRLLLPQIEYSLELFSFYCFNESSRIY